MTTCTQLSDLMPATALGRREWTPPEVQHLADCADCRAEWDVVRASARLGAGEDWKAEPAVLARLALAQAAYRRPDAVRYRRWLVGGVAAAAAVVLLVLFVPRKPRVSGSTTLIPSTVANTLAIPALDSLSEDELRVVLAAVSGSAFDVDAELDAPGLESLDSTGLEQVLTTMEGT